MNWGNDQQVLALEPEEVELPVQLHGDTMFPCLIPVRFPDAVATVPPTSVAFLAHKREASIVYTNSAASHLPLEKYVVSARFVVAKHEFLLLHASSVLK